MQKLQNKPARKGGNSNRARNAVRAITMSNAGSSPTFRAVPPNTGQWWPRPAVWVTSTPEAVVIHARSDGQVRRLGEISERLRRQINEEYRERQYSAALTFNHAPITHMADALKEVRL